MQLRGCLAWEERMILFPSLPLWDGKWFYVYCHLFKTTLKVKRELSGKFNWGGRDRRQGNTYIQGENDNMVAMQ